MNKYRNGHKSKYTKEQIIISLNNVVYENEKNMKLGSFHCHFYDRFWGNKCYLKININYKNE